MHDLRGAMRRSPLLTAFMLAVAALPCVAQAPERVVKGNTLVSERDPKITLEFREPVEYVGADRWVLYDVADCEVHVFVQADSSRKVLRLYWVQFEAYLPTVPHSYDGYNSPVRADIGGREFIVDGWFRPTGPGSGTGRPGSDREHVLKLLAAKGYALPNEMMMRRMVHLPTPDRRKELMIIYAEDLAPTGLTVADLNPGGKAESERPRLEKELLQRALDRIKAR